MWNSTKLAVIFFAATATAAAFGPDGILGSFPAAPTTAVKVAHLLCFATSWGATVWAIFGSGIVMFVNLPTHVMGRLRGKVFPACFALNAACTAASAAAFAWLHRPWKAAPPAAERRQLAVLVATAGFDLANLLIFTPRTIKEMRERHKVERGLGLDDRGSFEGWRRNSRSAMSDARLAVVNKRFWVAHFLSSVALVASTFGLAAHLWYLARKLAL